MRELGGMKRRKRIDSYVEKNELSGGNSTKELN